MSEELESIVFQCLEKEPDKRPKRGAYLAEALRRYRRGLAVTRFGYVVYVQAEGTSLNLVADTLRGSAEYSITVPGATELVARRSRPPGRRRPCTRPSHRANDRPAYCAW